MALNKIGSGEVMIQEDSQGYKKESPLYVTATEAKKLGISWKHEPPEPDVCQFCGKKTERPGLVFNGCVILWKPSPQRCDCENSKRYWEKHDAEEEKRKLMEERIQRQQAMQKRIDRLLGKSGIKKRFQQRTFANFITDTPQRKRAYAIAKSYADSFSTNYEKGIGLYIEGTYGTGKTHLAAAIALQLISEGTPVICKTSGDLLSDIKKSYDDGNVSEAEILDVYKKVKLLVIDDLGKEQCTDWSVSILYQILNDRYESMKPTIITTNFNKDDLVTVMTPRGSDKTKISAILSRLKEISKVISMVWEDFRTKEDKPK